MSVAPQYQQDCNALCTAAQSAREVPMQPRSNREKERPKSSQLFVVTKERRRMRGPHPVTDRSPASRFPNSNPSSTALQ